MPREGASATAFSKARWASSSLPRARSARPRLSDLTRADRPRAKVEFPLQEFGIEGNPTRERDYRILGLAGRREGAPDIGIRQAILRPEGDRLPMVGARLFRSPKRMQCEPEI